MAILTVLAALCSIAAAFPLSVPPRTLSRRSVNTSPNVLGLRRNAHSAIHPTLRSRQETSLTDANNGGYRFLAEVTFGDQTFDLIMDTGSSDTWVVEDGYQCTDTNKNPVDSSNCDFGPGFDIDSTFSQIAGENFSITYGDKTFVSGILGTESVTIAGITVPSQEVAVVTSADFVGDSGAVSGLMGLAFPALTDAYNGSTRTSYSSIMNTLFSDDLVSTQQFALAISRDTSATGNGGVLTIGGAPSSTDPTVNATGDYSTAAFEDLAGASELEFYAITVDSITYANAQNSTQNSTPTQYIVDSGTTLNFIPTADAAAFNALYDPPATTNADGYAVVECTATPPSFVVSIGGGVFGTNPLDLTSESDGGGMCLSGVQDAGIIGLNILGDVFHKNVLAVFDWGEQQMLFSSRMYYDS